MAILLIAAVAILICAYFVRKGAQSMGNDLEAKPGPILDATARAISTVSEIPKVELPLSTEAERLIRERPELWEYRLAEELLRSQAGPLRERFDALKSGRVPLVQRHVTEHEFLKFMSEKLVATAELTNRLMLLFNEEVMRAWGPRVPADPAAIQKAIARITGTGLQLYEWERELRSVIPPAEYAVLHQALCGTGEHVFGGVEEVVRQLGGLLADPNVHGQHVIGLTINALPNSAEIGKEINRISAAKNALLASLDAAQQAQASAVQAQRAAADAATAGLLAGLIGAWAGSHWLHPKNPNPPSPDDSRF